MSELTLCGYFLARQELDPPPWLNRMRELGYPPGYLGTSIISLMWIEILLITHVFVGFNLNLKRPS